MRWDHQQGRKKKDWATNQPTNPWTKPTAQKRNKVCEVDCWWIHPEPAECFYKCDSLIRKWNMGWSLGCCWTWASQSVFIRTVCSAIIAATGPRDVLQHAAIHHGWHAHTTDDSLSQTSLCYWTPPPPGCGAFFIDGCFISLCGKLKSVSQFPRRGSRDLGMGSTSLVRTEIS